MSWLSHTLKKATNGLSNAVGLDPAILGGIIGAVFAAPTGGMSLAWGAALGAGGAKFASTGDVKQSLQAGMMGYGLGSLATPYVGNGLTTATSSSVANPALQAGRATATINPSNALATPAAGMQAAAVEHAAANPELYANYANYTNSVASPSGLDNLTTGLNGVNNTKSETSMFDSPWMKYGLGALMLAGAGEDPNYQTIQSPSIPQSPTDKFYTDVNLYGYDKAVANAKAAGMENTPYVPYTNYHASPYLQYGA